MKTKLTKYLTAVISIALLILLDQWTKQLALQLKGKSDILLIPGVLQLHYLQNTGAAFSSLNGQMLLFYIVTPLLCLAVAYFYIRTPLNKKYLPINWICIFLFAGAVGNYIDRVANHYVIDFIYFSLINFPVFNVADIYVTCSVFLLILLILFYYKDQDFECYKPRRRN